VRAAQAQNREAQDSDFPTFPQGFVGFLDWTVCLMKNARHLPERSDRQKQPVSCQAIFGG